MRYENKVAWTIEPDRCALLIHDMQPHYLAALPAYQADAIIANVRAIGARCVDLGIPVFASRVPPTFDIRERGLMLDMWGGGPRAGNHDLDPRLGLSNSDTRPLVKRSYSAFFGNDFEVLLRRFGRDAVLIVGVYTSIGCYLSAADAFMRDIRAFLIADGTADLTIGSHQVGLALAAQTCARVITSEETLQALSSPPSTDKF